MSENDKIEPLKLYLIMAFMLIFGTCNTIVMKAQDEVVTHTEYVDPDTGKTSYMKFSHPYF